MKRYFSSTLAIILSFSFGVMITVTEKRYDRRVQTKAKYYQGRFAARRDIWNGKMVIRSYGMATAVHEDYVRLLKERYNIDLEDGGCSLPPRSGWRRGYDDEMAETIIQRIGRPALRQLSKDAEAQFDQRMKASTSSR